MQFSIVITTYNRLALLARAIESALCQTYPGEVVVVDDASSDGTEAYARALGDTIVYHRHSMNQGHSAAVNSGVRRATGNWIKLLDDDDYLLPTCLETIAEAIAAPRSSASGSVLHSEVSSKLCPGCFEQAQVVICSGQALPIDASGRQLGKRQTDGPSRYVRQEDIHYQMLLDKLPLGTPTQVAFLRQAFLRSGGWDSRFDGNCDDIYSWIKIAQYGDAVLIDKPLGYRTIWSGCYHKQLTLRQRWEMNVFIKQQICEQVSAKYRASLPSFRHIKNYLTLHWFMVGLKQHQPLAALQLVNVSCLSPQVWLLFFRIVSAKVAQRGGALKYRLQPKL